MKKRKGFTIIELLFTVALLAIIFGISIGTYTAVSRRAKQRLYESKKQIVLTAAEKYAGKNILTIQKDFETEISVDYLIYKGYITPDSTNGEFINPTNKTLMNCDSISIKNYGTETESITYVDAHDTAKTLNTCKNDLYNIIGNNIDGEVASGIWSNKDITLSLVEKDGTIESNNFIKKLVEKYGDNYKADYEWYTIHDGTEESLNITTPNIEFTNDQKTKITAKYTLNFNKYRFIDYIPVENAYDLLLDKTAPVINAFSITPDKTWAKSRTVNFTPTDNLSDIKSYEYIDQNGTTQTKHNTDNSISLIFDKELQNGILTITDNAGNTAQKTYTIVNIDNEKPTCSINLTGGTSITGNDSNTWYDNNHEPTVKVSMSDDHSVSLYSDSGFRESNGTAIKQDTSPTYSSGKNNVEYNVYDEAGNTNTCSTTVYVDKHNQSCSVNFSLIGTAKVTITNPGAGINSNVNTSGSATNANGWYLYYNINDDDNISKTDQYLAPKDTTSWNSNKDVLTFVLNSTDYPRYLKFYFQNKYGETISCAGNNTQYDSKVYIGIINNYDKDWNKSSFNIKMYSSGNTSQIVAWHYSFDGEYWYNFPSKFNNSTSFDIKIGADSPFASNYYDTYLFVKAVTPNNSSNIGYTHLMYDSREPTIKVTYNKTKSTSGYLNDVKMTIECTNSTTSAIVDRNDSNNYYAKGDETGANYTFVNSSSSTRTFYTTLNCYNQHNGKIASDAHDVVVYKKTTTSCQNAACSKCSCKTTKYKTYCKWVYNKSGATGLFYDYQCNKTTNDGTNTSGQKIKHYTYCSMENEYNGKFSGHNEYYYQSCSSSSYCAEYNACSSCGCK